MRVAVLDMYNNRPGQGIRGIRALLDGNPFVSSYEIFNVRGANQVPDTSFDVYISSGGPGNPLEQHFPWYNQWIALMDSLLNEHRGKKHVFLICHSFQVMCNHLNVADVRLRKSPAFGIFRFTKPAPGCPKLYLKNWLSRFTVLIHAIGKSYNLTCQSSMKWEHKCCA